MLQRYRSRSKVQLKPIGSLDARWVVIGQQHTRQLYLRKEIWYPFYTRAGLPRGRYGGAQKISSLPEFETRTIRAVGSRYIDCIIPAFKYINK